MLVDLVREASGEDEARARWAVRLVLSRSFTLSAPTSTQSISGGDQSQRWFQALIPFIDMANHAPDSIPVKQSSSHPVNDRSAGISAFTPIPRPVRATASWRVAQVTWGPAPGGRRGHFRTCSGSCDLGPASGANKSSVAVSSCFPGYCHCGHTCNSLTPSEGPLNVLLVL